ncbi:thioredoxin [Bdellovibrio bacteriovorus]|uniref:Thioredoxin n=1 Tax=Bdellovibrio bacteriovorus TaxID=959 RepID=A0A150WCJ4_BDEBC|nr:thioredoxin [Bdellovibrio bacteriovorus]KYG60696.1 thiol reductase thioredoxin [Bdellovibrio bacteriovorus]
MAVMVMTKDNIKETVENNQLVIIDFWATWCGPCRRFAPIFEAVALKHPDVVFAKVDTDAELELASQFEIKSIPTLAVIKEGDIIFVQPGALPEEIFEQVVEKSKEIDMAEVRKQNS